MNTASKEGRQGALSGGVVSMILAKGQQSGSKRGAIIGRG